MTTVLHVQGAGERGGAERILLSLLRHSPVNGVRPAVATFASGPFIAELAEHGVDVMPLGDAPRSREIWRLPEAGRRVAAAAREVGADVIQGNGERMGVLASLAGRGAAVPSVVWLHDAPMRSGSALAVELLLRASRPSAWVAGSAWLGRAFEQQWRTSVEVIRHGIDLDALPHTAADVRRELGWPADSVVVAHVARLQRWKGAEVFLRAAARAATMVPEARFVVVGGSLYGWERAYGDSLPMLARSLGLGDRIAFLGHRADALGVMAGADVVVHASLLPEPLGLVVPEAMAMARAVIATRTKGPEEVVDHGRTGVLLDPGDDHALADAIMSLVRDPQRRRELGEAAARTVQERWSGAVMAAQFAALYTRLTRA